jgi:uncharacterized protein (DUF2249 family)
MIINAHTKINSILSSSELALEAIIGINRHFQKLKNPVLRKLMAGRTTIAMASRIGGCSVEEFFSKLEPLGFEIDRKTSVTADRYEETPGLPPAFRDKHITVLDVRPLIEKGTDPLKIILKEVKKINNASILKVINSFVPSPLIEVLKSRGYDFYCSKKSEKEIETYFFIKQQKQVQEIEISSKKDQDDWFDWIMFFKAKMTELDVRGLIMPEPMHRILGALEELKPAHALFVYHERVPVFLLPELEQRGFNFRIHEIPNGQFFILIFRKDAETGRS